MIADIYIDVEQHLNAALSQGPLKETKNDTDEIPDYGCHRRDRHFEEQMLSLGVAAYYWNRTVKQEEKPQFVGDDIPTIESVFDLKSGARAKLVDRSGSMVIIEIDKYRSDWIEWSEVKTRIAAK